MTFREFNRIAEISSSAWLKTTMGACGLKVRQPMALEAVIRAIIGRARRGNI
jgi:hypothetical protein